MSYKIIKESNYYAGTITNENCITFLKDDEGGDILEFDTRKEVENLINVLDSEVYLLGNGEADRPSYTIFDEDNDSVDECIDPATILSEGYEDAVLIKKEKIPQKVLDEFDMTDSNFEGDYDDEYALHIHSVEFENKIYHQIYAISNLALELNADDLSCIDWEKEAYYCEELL